MKKIALLADVQGNETALMAVLKQLETESVDDIWFLGDLILPGSGGEGLFQLLRDHQVTTYIRGNWEDCFLEVLAGQVNLADPPDVYLAKLSQHLYQQLSKESLNLVKQLPLSLVKKVNRLTIGLFHHLPHKNYGRELLPAQPQEQFDMLFEDNTLDIVVTAHTHQQFLRRGSQGQLIINPGTVGQPFQHWPAFASDFRAQYAVLSIDEAGMAEVAFKKAAYDAAQEVAQAKQRHLPYATLYEEFFATGNVYTHDAERLRQYPMHMQYLEEVQAFLKDIQA